MSNGRSVLAGLTSLTLGMTLFAPGCSSPEDDVRAGWLRGPSVEELHARARTVNRDARPRPVGSGDAVGHQIYRIYSTEVIAAQAE